MQKSISERAKELTSKLTLREKIGQITQLPVGNVTRRLTVK